jgi:hypothetical protein
MDNLDFYHDDDLLAEIEERPQSLAESRVDELADRLARDGLDWHPQRLARAMIAYNDNVDPSNEAERLAIRLWTEGDGPGLMIGGVEITSGEIEVIERLEQINRENGYA